MNADILARIEAAGEALRATGEGHIAISYSAVDDEFRVGVIGSDGRWCDTWGHSQSAADAFVRALDRRMNENQREAA